MPNSRSSSSEMVVSEKPLLSKDTSPVNSKKNTSLPKVLKSAPLLSTPTTDRLNSHSGIPQDKKNLEDSEKDITSEPTPPFSCSMSPPESLIKTFPNGTKT